MSLKKKNKVLTILNENETNAAANDYGGDDDYDLYNSCSNKCNKVNNGRT